MWRGQYAEAVGDMKRGKTGEVGLEVSELYALVDFVQAQWAVDAGQLEGFAIGGLEGFVAPGAVVEAAVHLD
jgi:hypothetical protein